MSLETKSTPYGPVYRDVGGCKDDYENIATLDKYRYGRLLLHSRDRKVTITAQRPLLRALRAVEKRIGAEVVVTGSARSCELQASLYKSDPSRYAPPSAGLHCQALAIDVNTTWRSALSDADEAKFVAAMKAEGFTQARSDEPWHWSYGWTA